MSKATDLIAANINVVAAGAICDNLNDIDAAVTAAGTVITDAFDLTAKVNIVTSAAASTGVQVPVTNPGVMIIIKNTDSDTINVWPAAATIAYNGGSAGAAVTLAQNKTGLSIQTAATTAIWVALD